MKATKLEASAKAVQEITAGLIEAGISEDRITNDYENTGPYSLVGVVGGLEADCFCLHIDGAFSISNEYTFRNDRHKGKGDTVEVADVLWGGTANFKRAKSTGLYNASLIVDRAIKMISQN